MNWFRENRWLGTFLIVFGLCLVVALYFLFSAKSAFEAASNQFTEATAERTRLEHLNPFPNEANFQKMKQELVNYGAALNKLKEELKTQVLPALPLAPDEFQTHLRQAMNEASEKARANKVKLPDNFHLGFDEYTAALPNTTAAPLLGQELEQIRLLMNIVIDARVDSLIAFKRTLLPEEKAAPLASPTPSSARRPAGPIAGGPKMIDRAVVDLTFTSAPSAARKVVNQIASSNQQFFIIRMLRVRNDQEKGPSRENATNAAGGAAPAGTPPPAGAIKFIVGNEHIETAAQIEIARFTY